MDIRPRRSALYMPGSNARALEKARGLPADMLILDLEDAVAPDAKETARRQVTEALATGGYGSRELIVRVNSLETSWGRGDVAAIARGRADAVLLPKVESAAVVREAADLLAQHGAPESLRLWCMIETPRGVLRAAEIAAAHARLAGFIMGTSDLAKDLHARHVPGRLPLMVSLELCVLAARAHGLAILDGVHLDLDDAEGFAAACRQGAELGFDGKTLIHPKTIAVANETFAPRADEIAFAEKIIAAHADAKAKGQGVVVVDGKLIESLHVAEAKRLVALATAIRVRETD